MGKREKEEGRMCTCVCAAVIISYRETSRDAVFVHPRMHFCASIEAVFVHKRMHFLHFYTFSETFLYIFIAECSHGLSQKIQKEPVPDSELQNVKICTQIKYFEPSFTPRKASKSGQI